MKIESLFLNPRTKIETLFLLGYSCVAVLLMVFFIWSFNVPLADSSLVQGSVTVGSARQTVAHVDGGKIEQLFVQVGNLVEAGQPLIQLDDQSLRSELRVFQHQRYAKQARLDRLDSEREEASLPGFRESLQTKSRSDPIVQELLDGETRNFEARSETVRTRRAIIDHQIATASDKRTNLQQQLNSIDRQLAIARQQAASAEELSSRGYGTRARALTLRREVEVLVKQRLSVKGEIDDIAGVEKDAQFRRESHDADLINEIELERLKVIEDLANLDERIDIISTKIDNMIIVSNVSGIVVDLTVRSTRDVILPASPIMEIVPKNSKLLVEASIAPHKIDGIHEGTDVEVRFPAFAKGYVPTIGGEVSLVTADVVADDREPHYRVHVAIEDWDTIGGGFDVKPGMPVEIIIEKNRRTLFEYLAAPLADHLAKAFL